MTGSQVQRIVEGLGHEYMIDTFITETREGINQISDTVEYDYTNELVKIKKYDYKIASGAINATVEGNLLKNVSLLGIKRFAYRRPKVGDKIFLINKSNGTVTTTDKTITRISEREIELSGSISASNKYICFTGEDSISGLSAIPMQSFTLIKKFPISKHPYDVYLDMTKIVAIEMVSMTFGISGY